MTTITLKIDEQSEKGKALLAFLKAFQIEREVNVVKEPKSPYNKKFVEKIQKARREKGIELPQDKGIWEIIE